MKQNSGWLATFSASARTALHSHSTSFRSGHITGINRKPRCTSVSQILLLRRKTSVNADVIFNFVFENRERAPSETFIILLISSINMVEKYQKITVGGLLIKDDKVLVVRRSSAEPYLTGYYELPGGKVDFG